MGKTNIPFIVQYKPPPALLVSCKQAGVAANEAPKISKVTPEMLKAEAVDLADLSPGLDNDDDELVVNELVSDDVDGTQTANRYIVTIFMAR